MNARAALSPHVLAGAMLALLALVPWLPLESARPALPSAQRGEALPLLAALPPFGEFAAIATRPLFAPSRRPDAAQQSPVTGIEARYRLLGTVIAGKARHALVAPIAGGAHIELAEGATLDGWTVTRIEAAAITLASPAGADARLGLAARH